MRDSTSDVTVEAVNISDDIVVLNMGGVAFDVPITNYYDDDGDETLDRENAAGCVAGSDGFWVSLALGEGTCSLPQLSRLH